MTRPAYSLRPNKAADRFTLIEAIKRLAEMSDTGLKGYTYYGLGGPLLEDFRLLYEFYPEINMVSIERRDEVFKRQKFHRPCKSLKLVNRSVNSVIDNDILDNDKVIFWLDYTDLERRCFTEFQQLVEKLAHGSMIKITLRANPDEFRATDNSELNKCEDPFDTIFHEFLPPSYTSVPTFGGEFACLLQDMVDVAAQNILRLIAKDKKFIPVSSFYYKDTTWMFTLTGVVCSEGGMDKIKQAFADWPFANLTWKPPTRINVPDLSTKERLHLQPLLPVKTMSIRALYRRLGYMLGDSRSDTSYALRQYVRFHRHTPYFLRGTP